MPDQLHTIFSLAAKFFFRKFKEKGGSQKQLAAELGISKTYLSSIIGGSRSASIELQSRIAESLYGPYDRFLAVGRRLLEGKPPLPPGIQPDNSAETLIAQLTHHVVNHKKLQQELEETKSFFQQIVESIPAGVLVINRSDEIYYINQFFVEQIGLPKEKIIGVNILDHKKKFRAENINELQRYYRRAKNSLKTQHFENITITSLTDQQLYATGYMIPQVKEGLYAGMILTITDTTNVHTLLNMLKLHMDNSETARGIAAQNYPGSPVTIFYLNTRMRELIGQTTREFHNYSVTEALTAVSRILKYSDNFMQYVNKNLESGKDGKNFILEFNDGRKYLWSSNALYDDDGKYWGRSFKAENLKTEKID